MQTITFTYHGNPVAKGRPRHTRTGHTFTPAATRAAEEAFAAQAVQHRPEQPFTGRVGVSLAFALALPKTCRKRDGAPTAEGLRRINREVPFGKPDLDNLAKLVLDAMNGVFWLDDSQIDMLSISKTWTVGTPGVTVTVIGAYVGEQGGAA